MICGPWAKEFQRREVHAENIIVPTTNLLVAGAIEWRVCVCGGGQLISQICENFTASACAERAHYKRRENVMFMCCLRSSTLKNFLIYRSHEAAEARKKKVSSTARVERKEDGPKENTTKECVRLSITCNLLFAFIITTAKKNSTDNTCDERS